MLLKTENFQNSYEVSAEQQKLFLKEGISLGGQNPKERPKKEALLRTHARNLEILASAAVPARRELTLPVAYPASTKVIQELQKISISDLRLDTHHYGSVIIAKSITPLYQSSSLITVLENEGHVCIVSLNYHYTNITEPILPQDSTVIIKEPYFQFLGDNNYIIRVDHPSDIVIFRGDDNTMAMMMQVVQEKDSLGTVEWTNAGDQAYLQKNYSSAVECYTQAIEATLPEYSSTIKALHRKRAYANLTSKRFTAAKNDALASCSSDSPENSAAEAKIYHCAGRAAYELGLYEESRKHLSKALSLAPRNSTFQQDLARANERLKEQTQGSYDFDRMFRSVTKTKINLDHADFITNTRIGQTTYGGRGLFATKYIKAGDLVMVEKAFALPDIYGENSTNDTIMYNLNNSIVTQRSEAELFIQLLQKLYKNPVEEERFWNSDGGHYTRSGKEGQLIDETPVVDVFLVEAIRLRNCFSCPRLSQPTVELNSAADDKSLSSGFWRHAAYNNHSCVPNCTRSFIGDMMIIRAVRDIEINEELTQQYVEPEVRYTKRQEKFQQNWNFTCICVLCTAERSPVTSNLKARLDLVRRLTDQIMRIKQRNVNQGTIRTIERMTRKLEELHSKEDYGQIPRLLLVHPSIFLVEAYRSTRNPVKVLLWACEVLRNFGFVEPVRDGLLVLEGGGITNIETLNALKYAGHAYRELGMGALAEQFERETRMRYVILTGTEVGIDNYLSRKG